MSLFILKIQSLKNLSLHSDWGRWRNETTSISRFFNKALLILTIVLCSQVTLSWYCSLHVSFLHSGILIKKKIIAVSISELVACLKPQPPARGFCFFFDSKEWSETIILWDKSCSLEAGNRCRKTITGWNNFFISFYFSLFWNHFFFFFATEPHTITIGILFTSVEAPLKDFLKNFSIYFSLNSYICILILSSVVKQEDDITELDTIDIWWGK